jgi:hypothetical protein
MHFDVFFYRHSRVMGLFIQAYHAHLSSSLYPYIYSWYTCKLTSSVKVLDIENKNHIPNIIESTYFWYLSSMICGISLVVFVFFNILQKSGYNNDTILYLITQNCDLKDQSKFTFLTEEASTPLNRACLSKNTCIQILYILVYKSENLGMKLYFKDFQLIGMIKVIKFLPN